jgi:ketosteroid isomerase-like protein
LAIFGGIVVADTAADQKAVMATLNTMAKATVSKDVATLQKIYADDVTYAHSSALTQTKAEMLKSLQGQSVREFMNFTDTKIRIYADVAVAKEIVDSRSGVPGKMNTSHNNILWVMARRPQGPHGWQIVARQTTRIPSRTRSNFNLFATSARQGSVCRAFLASNEHAAAQAVGGLSRQASA